jgi:hypothetical protein
LRAVVAGLCGETGRADHVFPKYADKPEDLS